ncbi:hypothetical protein ANN_09394 [Periplaneta americana]|uniref:DUF4817 domain-containing protein n=1 Tax=Periplaneta americana TaxID=6978 RepID=A0ABQ8TL79_PERAM|nr:hypothetical protein ANN_09394 [Periplaneta americana]
MDALMVYDAFQTFANKGVTILRATTSTVDRSNISSICVVDNVNCTININMVFPEKFELRNHATLRNKQGVDAYYYGISQVLLRIYPYCCGITRVVLFQLSKKGSVVVLSLVAVGTTCGRDISSAEIYNCMQRDYRAPTNKDNYFKHRMFYSDLYSCHVQTTSLPSQETLRGHSDSSFRGEGYIQCCVGVRLCDMYLNQKLEEIHFMYSKTDGNAALTRRLYQERYPQRQCPDRKTFVRLHYRLCEYGKFNSPDLGRGRSRSTTPEVQEEILEAVNMTPSISTRRVALQVNVPHTTVWRLLKEYQLYPYHLQRVEALSPADYPARVRFCQWFLQQCGVNPNFPALVLFTDEAQFTPDGITNFHNQHVRVYENPRATVPSHHQVRFSLNMWAGIIGDRLVGHHVLVNKLTGQAYTNFLENIIPHVLEDTPLINLNTFTSCMMALLHTSVVRLAGTWTEGFLIDG